MPLPSESNQSDFDEVRRTADEFARHAYADVFARFERIRSGLDVNLPIVSAIIEREHGGEKEILVQTRWKPERDPLYSGTLEIPAGGMHVYENVYDAVKREVLEETGLRVTKFYPDLRTKTYAPKDDDCFAFVPYGQNTQTDFFTRGYESALICSLSCIPPCDDPYSPSNGTYTMEAEWRVVSPTAADNSDGLKTR